ncbi:MAG: hypothetical protein IIY46_06870 [Lachnospiraceae bacterium]|nr:hypothetical protein [Lachnospiraceae bacterium]
MTVFPDYEKDGSHRNRMVYGYYGLVLLMNRRKELSGPVTIISGKAQRTNAVSARLPQHVYRGPWFEKIGELRDGVTILTPFSFAEKLRLRFLSLRLYRKNHGKILDYILWQEFCFIAAFLNRVKPPCVYARGHFDECAVWLGKLCDLLGLEYRVYQHGVVSRKDVVPDRYPCTEFFVFDNYSADVFRANYISNPECVFTVYPFPPSVAFSTLERKTGYRYIGIVEQMNPDWVRQACAYFERKGEKAVYVIMKHPLSAAKYTEDEETLVTTVKYGNLDCLVTVNSTLLLDYYRNGYQGEVYVTDPDALEMFSGYPNVRCLDLKEMQ